MKIDDVGNVWLKCTEGSVFVTGILGEIIVKSDPIKVRGIKFTKFNCCIVFPGNIM